MPLSVDAKKRAACDVVGVTTKPAPLMWDYWRSRHRQLSETAAIQRPRVLFLGDSITENWQREGTKTWQACFQPLGAVNYGISGDRTQSLLWRLDDGNYAQMSPAVTVVLIGTNNLKEQRNTAEETARGVQSVVAWIRREMPASRIVLVGILPCGEYPDSLHRRDAEAVNRLLANTAPSIGVDFVDCHDSFVDAEGNVPEELMPDHLHLSPSGYNRFGTILLPAIHRALLDRGSPLP
jgi:lysophospholipase L1-like esterase